MQQQRPRPSGLIAATFTPFTSDGAVDDAVIPKIVDDLLANGVAGMYVLGSTGEGFSLTIEERRATAERFVEASAGRLPVIVQVGCESLAEARRLAAHAQQIGADAVSAVCPLYNKPLTVETLVESMAYVAGGAPELPFYYYHIPSKTGVALSMVDFLRQGESRIPTLRGIKYTSTDVEEFRSCVQFASGQFDMLWGLDERLLEGLTAGARAAVGSTYNFAAPIYHRLWAAFATGDYELAKQWQAMSRAIVDAFMPYGPRSAQKAIMAMRGLDCGPCRLPLKSLDPVDAEKLRSELAEIGFFEQTEHPTAPAYT